MLLKFHVNVYCRSTLILMLYRRLSHRPKLTKLALEQVPVSTRSVAVSGRSSFAICSIGGPGQDVDPLEGGVCNIQLQVTSKEIHSVCQADRV